MVHEDEYLKDDTWIIKKATREMIIKKTTRRNYNHVISIHICISIGITISLG